MNDPTETVTQPPAPQAGMTGPYAQDGTASALVSILDQYLADLQAGKAPDRERLLQEHPELAAQLEQCLAGIEFVHRAAKPQTETPTQLGDFRIVREVGRGGMGVVYEAEQQSLKRKVALKVLRFGAVADEEVMKRFQREAETVAHLHHTNIVPIHAVGCEQGVHYYAMQFIEGHSLAECLTGEPLTGFREIANWGMQAAEALAHAHQRGVIHRDIKPSNLILDPEGTVWLTDFGLAKRADEVTLTAAGVLMGTPRYMSPEQAALAKQPIDHRTDIYSLGATLYELATGKPVFDAQTPQGVITQILNTEPVAPRLIQGKLPRDLETIILKCLAKDQGRRYQSARDLADDLRAYLENRPIKARRPSLVEKTVRWARKKRGSALVAGVAAAAAVLLVVGAYLGWSAYRASLLAHLSLTTDGPALVAEILDQNDEVVLPGFAVPTAQPVTLPAGAYRLRLSGSGLLSETWSIELSRGDRQELPVKVLDRFLGPPLELRSYDPPQFIELNGQTHVFLRAERGWRLIDGATLNSAWPNDLAKFPEKQAELDDLLQITSWSTGYQPALTRPAVDLDGDGRDDLILASRVRPSLIALSGKDAKVLWWYRSMPHVPKEHDLTKDPLDIKEPIQSGAVIGQPILANLDGEPVVIAMFVSWNTFVKTRSGKQFNTGHGYYLEAVAARTGKELWRASLVPELDMQSPNNLGKFFPEKPVMVQANGRATIVLPIMTKLYGFDLKTGQEAWKPYDLGNRPIQAPHFADLDGDGEPEALFLYRTQEPDVNRPRNDPEWRLRAVSLKNQAQLWERLFLSPMHLSGDLREFGPKYIEVAELDGDGKPEIIIPVKDDWSKNGNHWFGVEVLDGKTGETRWQRRLWSLGSFAGGGSYPLRILAGPDLDGDGHAEVFVASIAAKDRPGLSADESATYLQVDALSGKDGRVLWRRRQKVAINAALNTVQWWQVGSDGWPQLVVPVDKGLGGQPMTYILSASSGRVTHLLPEVAEPQVADINSDGLPDLFYYTPYQGNGRRLVVIKGLPPLDWRRPGTLKPAEDYDGDGMVDFLSEETALNARSGRDGHVLWKAEFSRDGATRWGPNAQTLSIDLDGDGIKDVVLLEGVSNSNLAVSAYSGKDGHRFWRAPNFGLISSSVSSGGSGPQGDSSYPMLDHVVLCDGDRPTILVAGFVMQENVNLGLCLVALSGDDGHFLWKMPILRAAYTGQSPIDRNLSYDLDGDGYRDLVLWAPEKVDENGHPTGSVLRTYSGKDGRELWTSKPPTSYQPSHVWPRTAIADLDGDGIPEVVVTRSLTWKNEPGFGGVFAGELVVLDGRDGKVKWRWEWKATSEDVWPPLLVDADGDGKRRLICLGFNEPVPTGGSRGKIIVFDATGNIHLTIPMPQQIGQGNCTWAAIDVNGDGKEALLHRTATGMAAYDLREKKELWNWKGPNWTLRPVAIRQGPEGQPGTIVLWTNQIVQGVDTRTGATHWRCEVPLQDQFQLDTEVVHPSRGDGLPLVVSHHGSSAPLRPTTAQRALPTKPNGRYQPATPEPVAIAGPDTTVYRPLPWSDPPRGFKTSGEVLMLSGFMLSLLYWAYRRRWGRVIVFTTLPVILIATLVIWSMCLDMRHFEADERYSMAGWYWIVYSGGWLGLLPIFLWTICLVMFRLTRRLHSAT